MGNAPDIGYTERMRIGDIVNDESRRRAMFPVTGQRVFLGHAGVSPLSAAARDAMAADAERSTLDQQEAGPTDRQVLEARTIAAQLLGARASEIALLGPTTLGLNLVAHGLDWRQGDQVIYYPDDYPANVYPWADLERQGVEPVALEPPRLGQITWDLIEPLITKRTRLVALASANFVSGYRLDVDTIGRGLHERGILFSLDAIQTFGAFPLSVEHVDFLSADSHKWLLGPCGAGVFYVKRDHFDTLRPTLLGSWNVVSPAFIAQREIDFYAGARRYEPGTLNLPGIVGMAASMKLLAALGIDAVAARILELRRRLIEAMQPTGWKLYLHEIADEMPESACCGIVSFVHDSADAKAVLAQLAEAKITASLRQDRAGRAVLRLSPHFYNTVEELDHTVAVVREATHA